MEALIINWATDTPQSLRRYAAQQIVRVADPLPEGVRLSKIESAGPFRGGVLCEPLAHPIQGDIIYFHGGGFVTGSPEERSGTTAWIAALTERRVFSCAYRLAPEHDWQAIADDAAEALRYVIAGQTSRRPRVLAADSAGVSVALWGYQRLSPKERAKIGAFVFFYGAFGNPQPPSARSLGTVKNGLNFAALRAMYSRVGPDAPRVSQDTPPAMIPSLVIVGDRDPLLDESMDWHRATARCLPASRCVILPGQPHGFLRRAGQDEDVQKKVTAAGNWLDKLLN